MGVWPLQALASTRRQGCTLILAIIPVSESMEKMYSCLMLERGKLPCEHQGLFGHTVGFW